MSSSCSQPAALYMIATPIGHWNDLTLRAKEVLSRLQFIVCEDTRQTKILLKAHNILHRPQLLRGDEYTQEKVTPFVLEKLREGHDIGFVSDAGTPGVCDPGAVLVRAVLEASLKVIALPGASSVATFLSLSGYRGAQWHFGGFFPREAGALRKLCQKFRKEGGLWMGFESPHRVLKTLERCAQALPPETICIVGKELTKTYEAIWRDSISNMIQRLTDDPLLVQGEFVLGFEYVGEPMEPWSDAALSLEALLGRKQTSTWIAEHFHTKSSAVYDFLTQHAKQHP